MFDKLGPEKKTLIEQLLALPVLARLATANPKTGQPHLVPLWYLWDGECLWVSGFANTRKFNELLRNPRCAVLVEPAAAGDNQLQAVLLEGEAEVIAEPRQLVEEISTRIYLRYLGPEGVQAADPQSWIHDPLNRAVKLTPRQVYAW